MPTLFFLKRTDIAESELSASQKAAFVGSSIASAPSEWLQGALDDAESSGLLTAETRSNVEVRSLEMEFDDLEDWLGKALPGEIHHPGDGPQVVVGWLLKNDEDSPDFRPGPESLFSVIEVKPSNPGNHKMSCKD